MEVIFKGNIFPRPFAPPRIWRWGTRCTGLASSTDLKASSPCGGHPAQMAQVSRQCTLGSLPFVPEEFLPTGAWVTSWFSGLIKPHGGGSWAWRQGSPVCGHWWQAQVEGRKKGFHILCSTIPPTRDSGKEWEGSRSGQILLGPGPNLFRSNHHSINCLLFLSCVISLPLYWIIPTSLQICYNVPHLKNPKTSFDFPLPPKCAPFLCCLLLQNSKCCFNHWCQFLFFILSFHHLNHTFEPAAFLPQNHPWPPFHFAVKSQFSS